MNGDKLRKYGYRFIATEISKISRYFDHVYQVDRSKFDDGTLFDLVSSQNKKLTSTDQIKRSLPDVRSLYILNGNLNYETDIQKLLGNIKQNLSRYDRLACVVYNSYYKWIYKIANLLDLRRGPEPEVFLTRRHLNILAKLSGFELVRIKPSAYIPFRLFGLGNFLNRILPAIPGIRWLTFTSLVVLRPIFPSKCSPKLSIVIPARNEKGNIENAILRLTPFLAKVSTEIVFVEGHSKDDTWGEILRVKEKFQDQYEIKALQQTGKGKADAVRIGFSHCSGELLTILDADLTMPPELLNRFYDAWMEGNGDFINGSRLVYPMEDDSMRFLNQLGNIFFAKALSYVLDAELTDALCGTKLFSKVDYDRFIKWREDFGDIDPFGDFELIYPAVSMGLGIVDIPVAYRSRTYGSTNIDRFRHGLVLLKMTTAALLSIKFCRPYKFVNGQEKR